MSLFLRIFLFFWLTAVLLAASFFVLGRFTGSETIERKREILHEQAITVSTLWQQQNRHRVMHYWMRQFPGRDRPLLFDRDGNSPLPMFAERHRKLSHELKFPLKEGIQHHRFGHISLIVAVPETTPPLFLVAQIEPNQLHRLPMWLWLLSSFIIISLISYLLARILSQRIRLLRQAVQDFSEGDLERRVTVSGRDEVSALASDFNLMANRIQDMLNSQRQLVSDVSHELRSPLARLRIALELAQRAENNQNILPRIEKEADELENLVTELLSLARIESGQFQLERQPTDLSDLLRKIVRDANFEGEQKQCSVHLNAADNPILSVDPVLIRAAIENVIRNAMRYSPKQSVVDVSTRLDNQHYQILVEDSGPGVPESSIDNLFQPFARVAEARDRGSGGFGLGLAITGKTLQAHGGKAIAENRVEGGLRVILTLPIVAVE